MHSCEKRTCSEPRSNWELLRSPAIRSDRSRRNRGHMSLLRWIWVYLFACVYSHTTWPHQNQFALGYVCCLDCGREMSYSLKHRQIVGQNRKQNIWASRSAATASLIMAGTLLLLSPSYAAAEIAQPSADQCQTALVDYNIRPTLVIGFVGGFVHKDDIRHSEVQLARRMQETYCGRVTVEVFTNRQREQVRVAIIEWLNSVGALSNATPEPRIILFGHSWGASAVVYLARELEHDGIPVALTIQVDSVRKHRQDDSIIPANVAEAVNFYQSQGIIHGRAKIVAANPYRTAIVGNFNFTYQKEPDACRIYPWYDRMFFKGHTSIECDPRVWSQVQNLIEVRLRAPTHSTDAEVASAFH